MKNIPMLAFTLAMAALVAKPVFADHDHRHGEGAQAAQSNASGPVEYRNTDEGMMQYSLNTMQSQMAEIKQTQDPQKRQALLQEHNKSMRDSITMLREMMHGSSAGDYCDHRKGDHMMGGSMAGNHKMCDPRKDHHSAHHIGSADASPAANSNLDQIIATDKTPAKKLWVCPMHPDVVQDHPGACPKCGMDLVEMEQSGVSQTGHRHMMGSRMKCNNMKGDCKKSDNKGDGMKCGSKKGCCEKCQMNGMMEKRMDMILLLMEQMLEHSEAEMATPK